MTSVLNTMKGTRSNRSDISLALIHLTGQRGNISALDALIAILREQQIRASGYHGFIKGGQSATCFTEMPLAAVPRLVEHSKKFTKHPYESYGIAVHKSGAFSQGARPVIYLPDNEAGWLPDKERWRHVRFEYGDIDFTHEREWRSPGNFILSQEVYYVIVQTSKCEEKIRSSLAFQPQGILGFIHLQYFQDFI